MFALHSNQNQQPCRVQPSSQSSWFRWLLIGLKCACVVCLCVCVSWWQANGTRPDSFERDAVGADEEGRRDKNLFLKCNQSGAGLFWLAAADPVFTVIIGIANGDVVQLLRKNEKGFEEGIRGFFFFAPSTPVRLQTRDFSWNLPLMFFYSLRTFHGTRNESYRESSAPFEGSLLKLTCT